MNGNVVRFRRTLTCGSCNVPAVYDFAYGGWVCLECRGVLLTDKEVSESPKWQKWLSVSRPARDTEAEVEDVADVSTIMCPRCGVDVATDAWPACCEETWRG